MKKFEKVELGTMIGMLPIRCASAAGIGWVGGKLARMAMDAFGYSLPMKACICVAGLGISQLVSKRIDNFWVETQDEIIKMFKVVYNEKDEVESIEEVEEV